MKCEFCDSRFMVEKCACGHYACGKHAYLVSANTYWCIACYEAAKSDYESEQAERQIDLERYY